MTSEAHSAEDEARHRPAPQSGPAQLHHHPDGDDTDAMMVALHMCLAVLGAALLLVASAVLASWCRTPRRDRPQNRVGVAELPRPPPVSVRLAQLQVLRL